MNEKKRMVTGMVFVAVGTVIVIASLESRNDAGMIIGTSLLTIGPFVGSPPLIGPIVILMAALTWYLIISGQGFF